MAHISVGVDPPPVHLPPHIAQNASLAVASSYYDVARGSGWNILDGVLQWGPVVDGLLVPEQEEQLKQVMEHLEEEYLQSLLQLI